MENLNVLNIVSCNCGKTFKSIRSLNSHARFCEQYQKKDKRSKYFDSASSKYKCECGYETEKSQSLNAHFSHCAIHRSLIDKDCSETYWNERNHVGKMLGWDNFSNDKIQEIHEKTNETLRKKYKSGELTAAFKGKHHSEKTRKILSDIAVERKLNGTSPAHLGEHMSYLEKWFYTEILLKYNILNDFDVVREYCEKPYFIDFAFPNIKVGFELDGMFHLTDENHINHDKKRDDYLKNIGWTLYRFNYNQIKFETSETIKNILNIIHEYKDNKMCDNKLISYKEYKNIINSPVRELVDRHD